jgi:predicted short-subunit dehydrogenase-like oxidoreductase (DUF2520 family)
MTSDARHPNAPRLCVLGLGAVGRALGEELAMAGCRVRGWSPRMEMPLSEAGPVEPPLAPNFSFEARIDDALRGAQAILICVRDSAIAELAQRASVLIGAGERPVVLHTSGFYGPGLLEPLAQLGMPTGVLHPLTAVPSSPHARLFRTSGGGEELEQTRFLGGVWFATNGSAAACAQARTLIALVGGHELKLNAGADCQALYHAAAALLSNGAVALFDAAMQIAACASADRRAVHAAFANLLGTTSSNLRRHEPGEALTGPVSRGDVEVVRGHVEALARMADGEPGRANAGDLYRLLSARLIDLAAAAGRLDDEQRRELRAVIKGR